MRLIGLLLVVMWVTVACGSETAQNAAQTGVQVDIRDSIAAQGILSAPALDCVETDSGGYCLATLEPGEVEQFVRNIGMSTINTAGTSVMEGCSARSDFAAQPALTAYEVSGGLPPLTLPGGNRFSSIQLFYREDTQTACIEVTYATG
ncbi:MAG: hypothetical protein AAF653_04655 [Chloroflexota bacterium]